MKDFFLLVPVCSRKERRKGEIEKIKKKERKRRKEKRSNVEGGKVHKVSFPRMEERLLL